MNEEGILATPASSVEAIAELARDGQSPKTETFHEIPYAKGKLVPVLPPQATPIELHSLSGLVAFVKDEHPRNDATIHVASPTKVDLFGPMEPDFRTREYFARVTVPKGTEGFPFGQFMAVEEFTIIAQTRIEPSEALGNLLKLVGNLREEAVKTVEDDGVTQKVTARAGIARVMDVEVPNPIPLSPFRTFREVAQPTSKFIIRLRGGGDGKLPHAALFEADGGAWKLDAMQNVAAYFMQKLEGFRVIA